MTQERYGVQIRAVKEQNNGHWYKWSRKPYKSLRRVLQAFSQFKEETINYEYTN